MRVTTPLGRRPLLNSRSAVSARFGQGAGSIALPETSQPSGVKPKPRTGWSRWVLSQAVAALGKLPLAGHLSVLGGGFKVSRIDFPREDRETLRRLLDGSSAVFVAANYPEQRTNWLLNSVLVTQLAPDMVSWVPSNDIEADDTWTKKLWLGGNVFADDGADEAGRLATTHALKGHGVLVHPEEKPAWNGEHVYPLAEKIVVTAIETAQQSIDQALDKPVLIAPLVWKLRFMDGVLDTLHDEMGRIEKSLGLPSPEQWSPPFVTVRFMILQQNLLNRQIARLAPTTVDEAPQDTGQTEAKLPHKETYFDRAEQFTQRLIDDLSQRYGIEPNGSLEARVEQIENAVSQTKDPTTVLDLERIAEIKRLRYFSRERYLTRLTRKECDGGTSAETVAESLKLIHQWYIEGNGDEKVSRKLRKPVGWRTAHIRSAEPLNVTERVAAARAAGKTMEALKKELLVELRATMQTRLDELTEEVRPLSVRKVTGLANVEVRQALLPVEN